MFKLIAFDLDWTLAPSKWQMDSEMVLLFKKLLKKYKVSVISWGDYPQFQKQILPFLWDDEKLLSNLYICPTCGTKMYKYENNQWTKKYSLDFWEDEKEYIIKVLNKAIIDLELMPDKVWWELIEDRWTQITYSALWQKAPIKEKEKWDPDFLKRKKIRNYLLKDLQKYDILLWWSTSIDITRSWVDKAFWIEKLIEYLNVLNEEIIFIWDAVFPWWNDYPPLDKLWITTKKVFNIDDTKKIIKVLID